MAAAEHEHTGKGFLLNLSQHLFSSWNQICPVFLMDQTVSVVKFFDILLELIESISTLDERLGFFV